MTYPALFLVAALLWVPALAVFASPFIVSDATTTPDITHCAFWLDAAPKQVIDAPKDANGRAYCKLDISTIAPGSHTVTAAFVRTSDVWGTEEGPKSVPFGFSRPAGVTVSPSSLKLSQ